MLVRSDLLIWPDLNEMAAEIPDRKTLYPLLSFINISSDEEGKGQILGIENTAPRVSTEMVRSMLGALLFKEEQFLIKNLCDNAKVGKPINAEESFISPQTALDLHSLGKWKERYKVHPYIENRVILSVNKFNLTKKRGYYGIEYPDGRIGVYTEYESGLKLDNGYVDRVF